MPSNNSQPRVSLGRQQHSSEAIQSTTAKAAERLAELVSATNKQDLQVLAAEFMAEATADGLSSQHRNTSIQLIDLLIDRYPNCPRWASMAVDQLTVALELDIDDL